MRAIGYFFAEPLRAKHIQAQFIGVFATTDVFNEVSAKADGERLRAAVTDGSGKTLGIMALFQMQHSKEMSFVLSPETDIFPVRKMSMRFNVLSLSLYWDRIFTNLSLETGMSRGNRVLAIKECGQIVSYVALERSVPTLQNTMYYIYGATLGSYWLIRHRAYLLKKTEPHIRPKAQVCPSAIRTY